MTSCYEAVKKYGGLLKLHIAYLDKIEGKPSPIEDMDFNDISEMCISPQWTLTATVYRAIKELEKIPRISG